MKTAQGHHPLNSQYTVEAYIKIPSQLSASGALTAYDVFQFDGQNINLVGLPGYTYFGAGRYTDGDADVFTDKELPTDQWMHVLCTAKEGTAIVTASDLSVAAASLNSKSVTVVGRAEGSTTMTVTVSDGMETVDVTVPITVTAEPNTPVLMAGGISRTSASEATVTFTSDEAGTYYYAVVDDGAAAPSVDTSGTGTACQANTTGTISLTGLSTSGAQDIYIVVKDAAGSVSEALKTDVPAYSGSTGGGSGSGTTTTPAAPDVETSTKGNTTTTSGTIEWTADSAGKVSGSVGSKLADALVDGAKETEKGGGKAIVEIRLETDDSAASAEVTIPKASFGSLAGDTDAGLKIHTGMGSMTLDSAAVDTINAAASSGDVKISVGRADISGLPDADKARIGNRPVYDFTVTASGKTISSFGGGSANVSLPYMLSDGEDANAVVVYYISGSGELQTMRGKYNAAAGMAEFTATHFSRYAVGYNKVTFSDVAATAWYHDAVTFIAAREITAGTSASTFSPDGTLTRGQFIVMLMRAYGIEADSNSTDNFLDAGNTYYTNYLAAAKRLGISQGTGGNQFAPDSEIMREAMNALVKGGTISGSGGMLAPSGTSTRAQMAQVLFNLLSV
jgi:hypothetical protein